MEQQRKASPHLISAPTTRRRFLKVAATVGAAAIAGDATLLEPTRPCIARRSVSLRRWPARLEGFTIALLSDFHYDPYFSIHPLQAAVEMVNGLHPDVIVLTGDFVSIPYFWGDSERAASTAEPCARILGQMRARHGLWAVMGNHDSSTDQQIVSEALRGQGIQVLANQSAAIEQNGARFWLGGVNDVLSYTADLQETLHGVALGEPTVLLAHEPDFADEVARFPVDLQLSGHSHGGQVRFPFMPPLFLPELAKKYVHGLYEIGPLTLYTNAGLGTVGLPVRWNCPPEVTFLTLRPPTKQHLKK